MREIEMSHRKQRVEHLRGILLHHLGGESVLFADFRIEIRARAFGPLLRVDVQAPESEALRPAALPFKVVHQGPVEISFNRPVEIDRTPQLMNMARQITPTQLITRIVHAVLRDENGQVRITSHRPFDRVEQTFRDVGDEASFAQIGIHRIFAVRKEFARFSQVETDRIGRVIINAEIICVPLASGPWSFQWRLMIPR